MGELRGRERGRPRTDAVQGDEGSTGARRRRARRLPPPSRPGGHPAFAKSLQSAITTGDCILLTTRILSWALRLCQSSLGRDLRIGPSPTFLHDSPVLRASPYQGGRFATTQRRWRPRCCPGELSAPRRRLWRPAGSPLSGAPMRSLWVLCVPRSGASGWAAWSLCGGRRTRGAVWW